ncbi:DUF2142 domain-containing protein [Alloscardovia theropitheci]|nr:DUF2142 domain-containing protein [Alloscardovia theropitheci]
MNEISHPRVRSIIFSATMLFAVIAMVFGTIFVSIAPPFWGNDGMSQFARAYQISRGHFAPVEINWGDTGKSWGGRIPTDVWNLYVHTSDDLGKNPAEPAAEINDIAKYHELGSKKFSSSEQTIVWFTNTASYSPAAYIPISLTALVAEYVFHATITQTLWSMAFVSLLCYVIPVALGIFALRKSRLQWVIFALGLVPPMMAQISSITADSLTNGIAFLFLALIMKSLIAKQDLTKFEYAELAFSTLFLPVSKPTYIGLIFLACAVPLKKFSPLIARLAKAVTLSVSCALFAWWSVLSADTATYSAFYRADYSTSTFGLKPSFNWILTHPFGFIKQLFYAYVYRENFIFMNLIGSSGIRVPDTAMIVSWIAVIVALIAVPYTFVTVRQRWGLILSTLATFALIFGSLYISFTPVGFYLLDGVQGRYFFPLYPLFAILVLAFTSTRIVPQSLKMKNDLVGDITDDKSSMLALREQAFNKFGLKTIVTLSTLALIATLAKYITVVY